MALLSLIYRRCVRALGARSLGVLVAALVTLLAPRAARAAAPMCDPTAASAIAPIPVLPNATGELVAPRPCDDVLSIDVLDTSHRGDPRPLLDRAPLPPERILGGAPFTLPRPRGTAIALVDVAPRGPAGVHDDVYRPPRG